MAGLDRPAFTHNSVILGGHQPDVPRMRIAFRILLATLTVLTGALFLYSAYTKLFPVQSFEYTLSDQVHLSHRLAAIAARFFIGLEGALGALIILHLFGRGKWVLKMAFGLVAVFSIYLIWLWATAGNNVNCGCFGDAIWMSPSASLAKNAGLLVVLGLLIRYHNGFNFPWASLSAATFIVASIVCTYIFFPVFNRYKLDFAKIYEDKSLAPAVDLSKGKYVLAFLSPSCTHCRKAGLKMHNMKLHNPALPFYLIIGGTTSDLTDFWKTSHAEDLPHSRLAQDPFLVYTHGLFPTILWVNNGMVEADTGYPELDEKVIVKWMKP